MGQVIFAIETKSTMTTTTEAITIIDGANTPNTEVRVQRINIWKVLFGKPMFLHSKYITCS